MIPGHTKSWRRGRDSNPRYPSRYGRFRGGSFQPLTHLSASAGLRIVDNCGRWLIASLQFSKGSRGRHARHLKSVTNRRIIANGWVNDGTQNSRLGQCGISACSLLRSLRPGYSITTSDAAFTLVRITQPVVLLGSYFHLRRQCRLGSARQCRYLCDAGPLDSGVAAQVDHIAYWRLSRKKACRRSMQRAPSTPETTST